MNSPSTPPCSCLRYGVQQSQPRDLENFRQGGLDFLIARVVQANRKCPQNRVLLVFPRANHKRETELFPIRGIVTLELLDFRVREVYQTRPGLFAYGFTSQFAFARKLPDQIGI